MAQHGLDEEVDFAIVGAGCGGSVLAAKLAEAGYSVVLFDAGPFWRPLADFACDEREQDKLYWLDERISGGDDPIELGANNSGRAVGGTTTHFQMVSLRFRPDWFKARTRLGYGVDWPVEPGGDVALLRRGRAGADHLGADPLSLGAAARALSLPRARGQRGGPGPGPRRRGAGGGLGADAALHRLGAARQEPALRLSRHVQDRLFHQRQADDAGHLHAPRASPPGAEVRDLAMVGRVETDRDGPAERGGVPPRRALAAGRARNVSSPATRSRRRGCC